MPTYSYRCAHCGHAFDHHQGMTEDALVSCPSCMEPTLRRIVSGGLGVIFKGSGFYVNDSRPSGTHTHNNSSEAEDKQPPAGSENTQKTESANSNTDGAPSTETATGNASPPAQNTRNTGDGSAPAATTPTKDRAQ